MKGAVCIWLCKLAIWSSSYVQYHSNAMSHSLANFPRVKWLLNRVMNKCKENWEFKPQEVTSTWYGETWHNPFWVQQWVMSGEQSTRTCLLMSIWLATRTFLDSHLQLAHIIQETAYSYYKIQHVTRWNANASNSQNLVQAAIKS